VGGIVAVEVVLDGSETPGADVVGVDVVGVDVHEAMTMRAAA
jgi:hypothetical protein